MEKNRGSFRRQFVFWLDDMRPEESTLIDFIDELKQQRGYARAIRDGLRLIQDLRRGRVDVLIELFPHVSTLMRGNVSPAATMPTLPIFNALPPAEVRIIENEDERKKLSVANTLAALEDF